jgi:two-component system, OmpR family, response regulator RegX3
MSSEVTDMKKQIILIADDEPKIVDVLSLYLEKAGYDVVAAYTGSEALQMAEEIRPSLVVLDLMLPDVPGEEVCSILRTKSAVPILMLTAKHKDEERLRGLSIGADDYVTKPFNPNEVVARVGAILRRTSENELLADRIEYGDGDLVVDAVQQIAYKNGVNADLTMTEYKLLTTLARQPKRVFSREELIERVFGMDFRGDTRTIDAHIKNLRAKIENDPKHPVYVKTVYGIGYRFGGGDV